MRLQAKSKRLRCGGSRRRPNSRTALIALALVCAVPAAASAVSVPALESAPVASAVLTNSDLTRNATYQSISVLGTSADSSTQAISEASTESNRGIAVAVILALFAGLSGLTYSMWRELGRRVGAR